MRAFVYRAYDADGVLLYVGSTAQFERRMNQHRTQSAWWSRATRICAQPFSSYRRALFAERAAIFSEQPSFNRSGKQPAPCDEVGRRLRSLQAAREITTPEIARKLRVGDKTVRSWLSGARRPDANNLPKFAAILGVPVDALYARTDFTPSVVPYEAEYAERYRAEAEADVAAERRPILAEVHDITCFFSTHPHQASDHRSAA